ncbi:hypothetical protein PLIIFM63780_003731 [Purpureocillium lilacinum]|nr:hypothetical protein PLIIFM63780_003731 [Purpureocillium lilacinum]
MALPPHLRAHIQRRQLGIDNMDAEMDVGSLVKRLNEDESQVRALTEQLDRSGRRIGRGNGGDKQQAWKDLASSLNAMKLTATAALDLLEQRMEPEPETLLADYTTARLERRRVNASTQHQGGSPSRKAAGRATSSSYPPHWKPDPQFTRSGFNAADDPFVDGNTSPALPTLCGSPSPPAYLDDDSMASTLALTPTSGPEVHHIENASESFLDLSYHPEITQLTWPRVAYIVESSPASSDLTTDSQALTRGSRRVLLGNLPPEATAAQVLRSVRCYGGVISAVILPSTSSPVAGLTEMATAMIEFVYSTSAAGFVEVFNKNSHQVTFKDAHGRPYAVRAWLAPSHSYPIRPADRQLLERGATRAVKIAPVAEDTVWLVVTEAQYCLADKAVTIEFASIFEAERARALLQARRSWIGDEDPSAWLTICFVPDSCQGEVLARGLNSSGPVEHVYPDHISRMWNCHPYNQRVLNFNPSADNAGAAPATTPRRSKPLDKATIAGFLDLEPEELSPFLESRANWKGDITYGIIGSTAKLIRRAWGWRLTAEDDDKILMAHTLHDPEWADIWDDHFEARGEPNLRTWERYGALARHRRERAAQMGVEEWRVVPCAGGECEWACGTMKTAKVVTDYLKKARAFRRAPFGESDDEE